MTQHFAQDGTVVPVTLIEAGPCTVTGVRENPAGAQTAILGFGSKKGVAKPQKKEWEGLGQFAFVREFLVEGDAPARGDQITAEVFSAGELVNVTGTSKGRGFQGVVKRHGFHGSPKTHGHKDQHRMPGSIGAGGVQRVFKGTRMAGRMGGEQITVKNLEVVKVDAAKNVIAVKGAVPGARGSFVTLSATDGDVWRA